MKNKSFRVLVTWRLLIDNIDKYLVRFKKRNITIDLLKSSQHTKEKDLINIIHKYLSPIIMYSESFINTFHNSNIMHKYVS